MKSLSHATAVQGLVCACVQTGSGKLVARLSSGFAVQFGSYDLTVMQDSRGAKLQAP